MTENLIFDIFEGKLSPWSKRINKSAKRKALEEKIDNEEHYFAEKMPADDCKRFRALESLYNEKSFEDKVDMFSCGFTLGVSMMMEIASNKEDVISE